MEKHAQDIVFKLKQGNEEVFQNIFNSNYNTVLYFAKEYVLDYEIAREIAQDSFMVLWELRTKLRSDTNLTSYLITIARNKALNYLKHQLIEKKYSELTQINRLQYQINYSSLKDPSSDPFQYIELSEKIQKAIENLPPRCKQVFLMSRKDELKYKEIASQLNITLKTVEKQVSEALKRIRKAVGEYL